MELNDGCHERKEWRVQAISEYGDGVSEADERGKCEQKQKNENSVSKTEKYWNGSYTQAVPACQGKCQPLGWRKRQVWAEM